MEARDEKEKEAQAQEPMARDQQLAPPAFLGSIHKSGGPSFFGVLILEFPRIRDSYESSYYKDTHEEDPPPWPRQLARRRRQRLLKG